MKRDTGLSFGLENPDNLIADIKQATQ